MELSKVAVLIWICALLGFAVYCMTCAWHVWLRRNSLASWLGYDFLLELGSWQGEFVC